MVSDRGAILDAIYFMREQWIDPGYQKRTEAIDRTLDCGNRYTREAVEFAIDHLMESLSEDALSRWVEGREVVSHARTIGVLNAANIPLVGAQDLFACLLVGHRYRGSLSERSPFLLRGILDDIRAHVQVDADIWSLDRILESADAVIGSGTSETLAHLGRRCDKAGINERNRLFRKPTYSVAVLNGREDEDELAGLAEDCVLHEGLGCRNVAIVFAPADMNPDGLLEALSGARVRFPSHRDTPGSLEMSRAFLRATGSAHASGDGFLVSKGPPEVQQPCHVRWTEYEDDREPGGWMEDNCTDIQLVVSSAASSQGTLFQSRHTDFGSTQRPRIDWRPDGVDTLGFLCQL